MQYLKIDADTFIRYDADNRTSEVGSLKDLQDQAGKLSQNLPKIPDDKTLLAWAKENYPGIKDVGDTQVRLDAIKNEISEIGKVKVI